MPVSYLLSFLPPAIAGEISRLKMSHIGGLSEIRIRRSGLSTVRIGDSVLRLHGVIDRRGLDAIVERISGGALYAHRDTIAKGYISLERGIRVGIIGRAAYEGERLIGISDISSLLFRIPTGECAFSDELFSVFRSGIGSGMLIYSPPGVGKTTALRSLARMVGKDMTVSVVDERCEFVPEDYSGLRVDILRGYKRASGIEIATRTMAPDVIMTDELSAEDLHSVRDTLRCGIPIVATVHAGSIDEIRAKPSIRPLLASGAFSLALGISRAGNKYILRRDKL